MTEIRLIPDKPFHNNVDVAVIDYPESGNNQGRQRCKVTVEFAEIDVKDLQNRGLDFEGAMEYYKEWIYNVVRVHIGRDWKCVDGYDEVIGIIAEHVKLYY